MVNPFKEGTISWEIWERNNNPENKDFWLVVFNNKVRDEDEEKVREALKHAVQS